MRGKAVAGALIAFALGAVVPGAARAATVEVTDPCGDSGPSFGCSATWNFTAAPGEANDVSTSSAPSGTRIHDAGATLIAGHGCRSVSEHDADCGADTGFVMTGDGNDRVGHVAAALVDLGEGDDRLDAAVEFVRGGPGNDTLVGGQGLVNWEGGPGNDVMQADGNPTHLNGGPGDDVLTAGNGDDFLVGESGNDVLHGGGGNDFLGEAYAQPAADGEPDDDVFDGGPGRDSVSYARQPRPVTVDLSDPGPDGPAGQHDQLQGIETVAGGPRDDVLIGDAGDNRLVGGPGNDFLSGGPGADELEGGEGYDSFDGGAGNDVVSTSTYGFYYFIDYSAPFPDHLVSDPTDEPMHCGDGADLVVTYIDNPDKSCEAARFVAYTDFARFSLHPAALSRTTVKFRVPCPRGVRKKGRCPGRFTVAGYESTQRKRFAVSAKGGLVSLRRPATPTDGGADRIRIELRYDVRRGFYMDPEGYYGVATYLTL